MEKRHGCLRKRSWLSRFLGQWPQFCCFCHRKTDTGYDLCRYCLACLPSIVSKSESNGASSVCLGCGFVWPDSITRINCARCDNNQSRFERVVCAFRYDFPIDGMIARLKYGQHLPTGRILGNLLASEISQQIKPQDFPELLIPVPVNSARYRARGFNQAGEIAHWCGKSLGIRSFANGAGRRIDTGSLVGLSRVERGLRIRGAFWVNEQLKGRTVAIVDDVLTTGATTGELATELLDQGVAQVQLWVIARTPIGKSGAS